MLYRIDINTGNAAFGDYGSDEIARILRKLAGRIEGLPIQQLGELDLRDCNGNRVGAAVLTTTNDRKG